ncbi:MAG: PIN domain-containing protein [Hormoscilla sp. SP5CHS1]|nr:PIN domain-containing protein [Hormoscilla sp. SP12CHS1]MBC6453847.1 PIN domain-containing protein [Hormoscilla sp. SP5CHS1]
MSESLSKAVLDACVIFRAALRDTLLRAASAGLYEVYWSDTILQEVSRNLVENGRMSPQQAQRLLMRMNEFFPNATASGFERLIPIMTNDEKDRHVLAAAVVVEATVIVTSNLRDFPDRALAPLGIQALSPDKFLMRLFYEYSERMMRIITEQAAQLRNPPKTVEEVLDELALDAPQFAAAIRSGLGERE